MSQAARLLGLRADVLRRWIDGYERAGKSYSPVIREERSGADAVTWGEFVEAGYLREYRAKQVTLQYLRPVIAILREELGVRYPLATLKPYTSGRNLALKVQKQVGLDPSLNIVVLGRDGTLQLTDAAEAFLQKVDFADGGTRDARRLYPLGRSVPVVLDPDHGFGEPTLISGARTEAVAELITAGETRQRVADFYEHQHRRRRRSRALRKRPRRLTSNATPTSFPTLPTSAPCANISARSCCFRHPRMPATATSRSRRSCSSTHARTTSPPYCSQLTARTTRRCGDSARTKAWMTPSMLSALPRR